MIAYACNPQGTGEHWLGWGWAEQAARNYEVDLITTPKARDAVDAVSRPLGITAHFVDVPGWFRKATELAGAGWQRKFAWQKRVARLARELQDRKRFSIVHQTTFHSFRAPFRAAALGIPSVWGPIAGGEHVPPGFERYLGQARFSECARNLVNQLSLHFPGVKRSLRQVGQIFVSNQTTLRFLPPEARSKCRVVPPNALRARDEALVAEPLKPAASGPAFRLIYVGNCVATRAIPLVFEALEKSELPDFQFTIVGSGPALDYWKRLLTSMRIGAKVRFAGQLPHARLDEVYASADALVFPALRDSGGSALLEAMARGLPVVCLDWAGPGEMIDERSGIKVPVNRPPETVEALAAAFARLHRHPELRESLAAGARQRVQDHFRWTAKKRILDETYQSLISG
jgi:glycosyltransferase involved in cell wall biosynthesis